jgi:hypothetical protein
MATAYSTGYYVSSNWANTGVVGCPGIPSALGGTKTTFVYSIANGGAGQYLPMTTTWSTSLSRYDFDAITNGPGNVCAPLAIPKPVLTLDHQDASYYYFTVTWPAITNLKGYYDAEPADIITGIVIRTNTSNADQHTSAGWAVGTLDDASAAVVTFSGSDPGTLPGGRYLRLAKPTAQMFVATSLLFENAAPGDPIRETAFVSGPAIVIGPTASPLFANVTADPTTVSWTSGDESRVASYQAYMSLTQNGTYKPIGQPVAALGSGHSYTVNYRVVAPTYYVKIKASKTDGTFVWSSPVKVTRIVPEPKPLPGKSGLRK